MRVTKIFFFPHVFMYLLRLVYMRFLAECVVVLAATYLSGCSDRTNTPSTTISPGGIVDELGERKMSPFGKSFSSPKFETPREYVKLFQDFIANKTFEYMNLQDREFNSSISSSSLCPPKTVTIDSKVFTMNSRPSEKGSESTIFTTSDEQLIVKRVDKDLEFLLDTLWRDEAALVLMEDAVGVSPIPLVDQGTSMSGGICKLRTFVMTNEGMNTLYDLFAKNDGGTLDIETALAIGRRAIRLVEQVHKRGLIHGDIHWGNFVYSNESDVPGSLKLIDYGRAMPYVDALTGQHLPPEMMKARESPRFAWNDAYLSLNELLGNPIGRRDDMFRLGEMLSFLVEGPDAILEKRPPRSRAAPENMARPRGADRDVLVVKRHVISKKRFRKLKQTTPKAIAQLYYTSQDMKLEDTPDYNVLDMYS